MEKSMETTINCFGYIGIMEKTILKKKKKKKKKKKQRKTII